MKGKRRTTEEKIRMPALVAAFMIGLCTGWPVLGGPGAGQAAIRSKDGYAELAGGRVYYRDLGGSGPVVVLLHPGSGNCFVFEKQIEPLAAAGYRVVAYDRRGHGRSARNAPGTGSTARTPSQAPELEQLMDYLKVERFHLVGVAAGGGVALEYALRQPDRVLSLVVANSIGNVQDADYLAMGQRLRPPAFNQLPLEIRELGPSYRAVNPDGVRRWLEVSQPQPQGPTQDQATPAAPGDDRRPRPAEGPAGGRDVPVTFAALEKSSIPILLLTGDADLYTPPSVLRIFKQHMRSAEMFVITESGHAAHWENPDEFNRRVLAFLSKH